MTVQVQKALVENDFGTGFKLEKIGKKQQYSLNMNLRTMNNEIF